MIEATLFTNFRICGGNMPLFTILDDILCGKYEVPVNLHRAALQAGDTSTAERIKKALPAFTVSATYRNARRIEQLTGYNPLQILDIDNLDPADISRLRKQVNDAPYTVCSFLSPGARGLKIIAYTAVDIELHPRNHRAIYNTLKEWYTDLLKVEIDASGSDAGRLCFVSYDPELYLSPRFTGWLRTGEGLPDGLPLLTPQAKRPRKAAVPADPAKLLAAARKRMDKQEAYCEGNRNNYVYRFACLCNRMGVPAQNLVDYCTANFADLSSEECNNAVASACNNREEYNTLPQKVNGKKVEMIQQYLSEYFMLRKNVVRGMIEYREKRKRYKEYLPVTDYWENTVWCNLQLQGIFCKISELRSVIHSDFSKEYDPFKSYFGKLPAWDGETDPIGQLAATVDTTCPEYWVKCLKKWLVAVVACAINERKANHTVLLLSGAQGLGKTTWLRNLVPPVLRNYVYSGNLDPTAKDSSLLMSDCFLIILDELSGQSRVELNQLKALITKDSILERRPYARNAETFVRRASFAATVNDSQILTDRTGSRRFLCFETLRIDYTSGIDHAAIYAQALGLYKQGFRYWFADKDITEINENNEPFQQSSPEAELLFTYFRKPVRFEVYILLSTSEIMAKIAERTRYSVTTMSVNQLGKVLKSAGFESQKRHGKRLFAVIELTNDQIEARRKGFGYDPVDGVDNSDNKEDSGGVHPDYKLPF